MDETKTCNICLNTLPIQEFAKKNKRQYRGYCKKCNTIRKELLLIKQLREPELDNKEEIEVRGRNRNGRKYRSIVTYEKAMQLVEEKVARIIHSTLIQKIYDEETFRTMIFEKENGKCFYCGQEATTIDHIIPRSKGGSSTFYNCVASCSKCNEDKDSLPVDTFLYYYPVPAPSSLTKEEYAREQLKEAGKTVDALDNYINISLQQLAGSGSELCISEIEELKSKLGSLLDKLKTNGTGEEA